MELEELVDTLRDVETRNGRKRTEKRYADICSRLNLDASAMRPVELSWPMSLSQ